MIKKIRVREMTQRGGRKETSFSSIPNRRDIEKIKGNMQE